MNRKIIVLGILFTVLFIAIGGGIYLFFFKKTIDLPADNQIQTVSEQKSIHDKCSADNEISEYKLEDQRANITTANIFVRDKLTNSELLLFTIRDVRTSYHPLEIHRCGIYVIREFNFDYQKFKPQLGFNWTLWKYDYTGNGAEFITFSKKVGDDNSIHYFSTDFRINSLEKYIVLRKGYLGKENYAIIIKDLKSLQDVFTLPITEIEKKNPDIVGDISFESTSGFGWTRDGRYFWARTSYGANTLGFIRIDTTNWNVDLMLAPKDALGGDVLNFENGYITVHPGNVWFGIAEITEEEKAKRRAQGMGTELYIENLFTKERQFVTKTDEPLWYFKPRWISDSELRYIEPSGERKIYKLK